MPDSYQRKMTEQGYNYMEDAVTLHHMAEFFETRCKHLEVKPTSKKSNKKASKKRKAVQFASSDEESSEDEENTLEDSEESEPHQTENSLRPFHLAFPVDDLPAARKFYTEVLGCTTGREKEESCVFNFYGH